MSRYNCVRWSRVAVRKRRTEFNRAKAIVTLFSAYVPLRSALEGQTCTRGVSKWVLFGRRHALIRLSPGAFSEREDGDRRCAPLRAPSGRGAHALRGMRWSRCRGWRGCRRGSAGDPLGHSRHAGQDTPQVSRSSDGAPQETQRRPHQDLQAHQRGKKSFVTIYSRKVQHNAEVRVSLLIILFFKI